MHLPKKFLSAFLVCFIFVLTGCTDQSWSLRADGASLSSGTYIYFLFESYQEASGKVSSTNPQATEILDETIDEKNASDWIKDEAQKKCKNMIAVDKKFEELGLSLSEEELSTAQSTTDSYWNRISKRFEEYGISKDSFHKAATLYPLKSQKLFDFLYEKNGSKAVSDEEILNFYKENYVYYTLGYKLKKTDSTSQEGQSTTTENGEINNETIKTEDTTEALFKEYVEQINSNSKTIDQIKADFKEKEKSENDVFTDQAMPYEDISDDDIKEALKKLDINKATSLEKNGVFFLLFKRDINQKLPDLSKADERTQILQRMKTSEYENFLTETANGLNISVNNGVVNKFQPEMFQA